MQDKMATNTCDICAQTTGITDEVLFYGEWMKKQDITVHYYCLLLSTNLPQRGGDSSGILGFLIRDIRNTVNLSKRLKCTYCEKPGANIMCSGCRIYFHLVCGHTHHATFQFCREFRSFCSNCIPLDEYKLELLAKPPNDPICDICLQQIGDFTLPRIVYGDCCRKGFAHRICMQRYALASGYYLRCIWCRKEEFRDLIRLQSVFVPDRDATWERERAAFSELYYKRVRCDLSQCKCPYSRDYNKNSWTILMCNLCAASGAHLKCIPSRKCSSQNNFKCPICLEVERKLPRNKGNSNIDQSDRPSTPRSHEDRIDSSYYVQKSFDNDKSVSQAQLSPMFSDDDTTSSISQITVIATQNYDPDIIVPIENVKPRLVLKECYNIKNEPYFYVEFYEFDNQTGGCIGTCTMRFSETDERVRDHSQKALEEIQITEEDVWSRDSNRGIYEEIDKFIEKYYH